jgi:putative inorganic carbon (HCO3(-)) transporter
VILRRSGGLGAMLAALALGVLIGVGTALSPILAVATAGLIALVIAVFLKPEAVMVLLVLAFPWDDELAFPSATVGVIKILGVLVLVGYTIRALTDRDEHVRIPPTLPPLLLFLTLVLISLLFSDEPSEGLQKTLRYVLFVGFFFLFVQLVKTRATLQWCLRALALSASLASIIALVNFATGATGRAEGPIGEANDFAYLLVTVLPLVGYLISSEPKRRALWIACFVLLVTTLLATFSRGAFVGVAALAVWAVATRRVPLRGLAAGALVVAAVLAVAFSQWRPLIDEHLLLKDKVASANVGTRKALWSAAVRMTGDHPLIGVGPNGFSLKAADYLRDDPLGIQDPVAHNSFLEIMAESGVPALLVFLIFLAGSWQMLLRAYRENRRRGDLTGVRLATAAQASMVAAVVSANFLSVQLTIPLWLVGGIAVVLASEAGTLRAPARQRVPVRPLAARAG